MDPAEEAAFRALRQKSFDYFDFYRRGVPDTWVESQRQATYLKLPLPIPLPMAGHDRTELGSRWQVALHTTQRWTQVEEPPQRTDAFPDGVMIAINDMSRKATLAGLQPRRILGYGGNGVAALYEATSGTSGQIIRMRFVAKCSLTVGSTEGIVNEKATMDILEFAEHIVQRWTAERLRRTLFPFRPAHQARPFDDDPRLLLMEYQELGDMATLLKKTSSAGGFLESRVLWHILDCLVKGCIAMNRPPKFQSWNGTMRGTPTITERMPHIIEDTSRCTEFNIVHFDIDPWNVWISSRSDSHQLRAGMPVFKLGDFGLAMNADATLLNDDPEMWMKRRAGKKGFRAPEQFTDQWDYVDRNPRKEHSGFSIAGNYGSHTNVWGIGQIMYSAITSVHPEMPPVPEHPENQTYWSYARGLIEEMAHMKQYVDPALLALVVDMLAEDPANRPTLKELELEVNEALVYQADTGGFTDQDVRQWATNFFGGPPLPAWQTNDPRRPFGQAPPTF